ncbi:MAG: methylated-DNA--[protein]-cysteine S-methyltransferase [Fimbriimonas sp.]
MSYVFKTIESPVGGLKLVAREGKLVAILWEDDRPNRVRLGPMIESEDDPTLREVERQLGEYFRGERRDFALDLDFAGTDFQKRVWNALVAIPYGEIKTYRQIATELGNPNATRAVGAANGRNPISIVAPCHRLIGTAGDLRGFAGGLAAKEYLLRLEGKASAS